MNEQPVLALDFGTTNTYMSKCPAAKIASEGVDFGHGQDGMSTVVLYRRDKPPIVGETAMEEYGDATEAERRNACYELRAQFKPDIARSNEARQYAVDFLQGILTEAEQRHIDINPKTRRVMVGAPSEADAEYRQALTQAAEQAGYGAIHIVDEPKGAIYHHVQRKDITPLEAIQGTLVVDFGGGTCDFAHIVRGEVRTSWGDMYLGGRLFDDLFFQWFVDQNPAAMKQMQREHAVFYTFWVTCRQIKEKFSMAMGMDREKTFRKIVGEYGRLHDATWAEYLERAAHYQPSTILLEHLRSINPRMTEFLESKSTLDLHAWFRQALRSGLEDQRLREQPVTCAVLTGGSSSWPWVYDDTRTVLTDLGFHPRIVRSDRPYATIAMGLAAIPALQQHLGRTQTDLQREKDDFIACKAMRLFHDDIASAADRIAHEVAMALFDAKIAPLLRAFREQGGSVAGLRKQIEERTTAYERDLQKTISDTMNSVFSGLSTRIAEALAHWFQQHDLLVDQPLKHNGNDRATETGLDIAAPDVFSGIQNTITILGVAIGSTVIAGISGGGGIALIISGPLGLVIGAVIGFIATTLLTRYGLKKARIIAEHYEGIPTWFLKATITDAKIVRIREDLIARIKKRIQETGEHEKSAFEDSVRKRVEQEIDNLSAIMKIGMG